MKRILVINGHPNEDSYCRALAKSYSAGAASAGHQVVTINLCELDFELNFKGSYAQEKQGTVEPDLLMMREKLIWAEHVVIVHPVWWGAVPALLKGFFDRTLVPGFAFKYKPDSHLWEKLLAGRTGRIIYTADTPPWFNRIVYRAPSVNMVRDRVLGFCGISTKGVTGIGPIRRSTPEFRENWIIKVENLGRRAA